MACTGGVNLTGLIPVFLNLLDITLTIIGLIPAPIPIAGQVGMAADATTIVLNLLMEEPVAAVLSAIALIPVAGQLSGVMKIVYKVSVILTYFLGSPLIQLAIATFVLGMLFLLYYFIYYI